MGGGPALVEALFSVCRARGVELQSEAEVGRIRVESGRVVGVELVDGTPIDADCVLSCIGPRRTLLDLVDPEALPTRMAALSAIRAAGRGCRWPPWPRTGVD